MSDRKPLLGVRVLVTRPEHQAEALCNAIEKAGGIALRLPALEITQPSDPHALRELGQRLGDFDLAIFVSPNAVRGALKWLGQRPPPGLKLAAVGPVTGKTLMDAGFQDVIMPSSEFNSEALLRLPELRDVRGKRILIFRGDSGRGLLREILESREATVEYAEVYRREMPGIPSGGVQAALRKRQVDAVTVTSAQALEQLVRICDDDLLGGLLKAQLVVSSERMVKLAESLGFDKPLVAAEPGDQAMVEALVTWRTGPPPQEIAYPDD